MRGAWRDPVFLSSEDRNAFVRALAAVSPAAGLSIWAYALMTNHVHLIAVPDDRRSISNALRRCLEDYSAWFHDRHGIGSRWHDRVYSAVIPFRYLWNAVRYVERNPVTAGIVACAEEYRWSSAAYHCGLRRDDPLIPPRSPLKGALGDWSAWLREPDVDIRLAAMRRRRKPNDCSGKFVGLFEHMLDLRIARWEREKTSRQTLK